MIKQQRHVITANVKQK